MKFNIQNPAFLQMAGNVAGLPTGEFLVTLSGGGDLVCHQCKGKIEVTNRGRTTKYVNPESISLHSYDGTFQVKGSVGDIRLVGNGFMDLLGVSQLSFSDPTSITTFRAGATQLIGISGITFDGFPNLQHINIGTYNSGMSPLSAKDCQSLVDVEIGSSSSVTELILSNCSNLKTISCMSALTKLSVNGCTSLETLSNLTISSGISYIDCVAVRSEVADVIASAITNSSVTNGTVVLHGETYDSVIASAASDKGWTVQNA